MKSKFRKYVLSLIISISLICVFVAGCSGTEESVTFSGLISQPNKYNGKAVTLEAYYFSGFEISALAGSVGPATSGPWRIVPTGTLIWVASGISQGLIDSLYAQTDAPSGYTERIGKLKVTGNFETGGHYGHLDAYNYQINITSAKMLEWSPPPASPQ